MEREIQHFSHEHLLFLKAEGYKTDNDDTDHPDMQMTCHGCRMQIAGPVYSCDECGYFLHKTCAELPKEMNHPMHPKHPLTLLSRPTYSDGIFSCNICSRFGEQFVYSCSDCSFDVDMICASASHTIEDKCHQHPLTPLQLPISFPCHLCRLEEKGLSYKCNICPFWVHQNCTILLTDTVKHSHHHHLLTFMLSVPFENDYFSEHCDICHDRLSPLLCLYSCAICMFFAHVSCAISETTPSSSVSRDQNIEVNQDLLPDGQCIILLPPQLNSTDLISWFVESYYDRNANMHNKKDHFDHKHPLFLIDEQITEKICQACAVPIVTPPYGCIECDYFLHKCCTELPKQILHPSHPEHEVSLYNCDGVFECCCCSQWYNGFGYKCLKCEKYFMDIKCASLIRPIYHEAHKHPLIPRLLSSRQICSACGYAYASRCFLQCDTCSFKLCIGCAMSPPTIKHRWDKHPFLLTYSPPENHYNEYYCALCEKALNPKGWFYQCHFCDQFAHVVCMLEHSADSNIKYGVSYIFDDHRHDLTLIDCTYSDSPCNYCRNPTKTDYSVGLECKLCHFNIHLKCLECIRD